MCVRVCVCVRTRVSLWLQDYEPRFWYFEVIEMFRKLLLTGVAVLFLPGSVAQVFFAVIVTVVSAALYLKLQPFIKNSTDVMSTVSLWSLAAQMLVALALRVAQTKDADATLNPASGFLALNRFMVFLSVIVPLVMFFVGVVSVFEALWEKFLKDNPHLAVQLELLRWWERYLLILNSNGKLNGLMMRCMSRNVQRKMEVTKQRLSVVSLGLSSPISVNGDPASPRSPRTPGSPPNRSSSKFIENPLLRSLSRTPTGLGEVEAQSTPRAALPMPPNHPHAIVTEDEADGKV